MLLSDSSLHRPQPRLATPGMFPPLPVTMTPSMSSSMSSSMTPSVSPLVTLGSGSRLSADYTTYDDEIASFTRNSNTSNTPVPNIKTKFEPKNEVIIIKM